MTPSARIHTGRMQIFFGGSAAFGTRGQLAVDFPEGKEIQKNIAIKNFINEEACNSSELHAFACFYL